MWKCILKADPKRCIQRAAQAHRASGPFQQVFTATVNAGDHRVGAIVEAFDQALAAVLGDLASWVNKQGRDSLATANG